MDEQPDTRPPDIGASHESSPTMPPSTTTLRAPVRPSQFEVPLAPVPAWVPDYSPGKMHGQVAITPPPEPSTPQAPVSAETVSAAASFDMSLPEADGAEPAVEPVSSSEFDLPSVPAWTTYRSPGVELNEPDGKAPAGLPRNPLDLDFELDLTTPSTEVTSPDATTQQAGSPALPEPAIDLPADPVSEPTAVTSPPEPPDPQAFAAAEMASETSAFDMPESGAQESEPAIMPELLSEFDLPPIPAWTTYRSPGIERSTDDSDATTDLPDSPIDLDLPPLSTDAPADVTAQDALSPDRSAPEQRSSDPADLELPTIFAWTASSPEPTAPESMADEALLPGSPPKPDWIAEQAAAPSDSDADPALASLPSLETQETRADAAPQARNADLPASTSGTAGEPALPDQAAALEAGPAAAPHFNSEPLARAPAAAARRGIARLIEYRRERYVAFAPHTTIELVENPAIIEVPGAASYGLGLMSWQGGWLPVIDLAWLLHGKPPSVQDAPAPRYALVLAYQPAPRQAVAHGAIALELLPQFAAVSDTQLCPWPDAHPRWPQLGLSCFAHEGQAVPILDTSRLFTNYHPPWATPP